MKITIKQIIDYAESRMSEEAIGLWVHLLTHPEDLELLECYLMCRVCFGEGENDQDSSFLFGQLVAMILFWPTHVFR